jgi:hypothetical protein
MDIPTYQQILAEQYEETAKTVYVVANEHEDEVHPHDHHPDELEDQDDFNREQGSHSLAWNIPKPPGNKNTSNTDVSFNKQTQVQLINIDSRFRNAIDNKDNLTAKELTTFTTLNYSSSNFLFKLKQPIKNVISVRLSSIELPNTFYSFSTSRGNTSFYITYPSSISLTPGTPVLVTIPDGNWVNTSPAITATLAYQVQTAINSNYLTKPFKVSFDQSTGLFTIASGTGSALETPFDINWKTGKFNSRVADFGLGYNLGYRQSNYIGVRGITAEAVANIVDTNYVFLTLDPDWKVVVQETPDRTQLFSFAKVIVDSPKFQVTYDNSNKLTKEYFLKQPTNIISIPVRLSDPYDQDIDLRGADFSFSLEVREVLDFSLYETMRG